MRMTFQFNFTIEDHLEDELTSLGDGAFWPYIPHKSLQSPERQKVHRDKNIPQNNLTCCRTICGNISQREMRLPLKTPDSSFAAANSSNDLEPHGKALLESCQRACYA